MYEKELIKRMQYDPLKIGIEILKQNGYYVEEMKYSDSVYVYKDDKRQDCIFPN